MAGINLVRLSTKEIPYGGKYGFEVIFKNTGTSARDAIIGVSLNEHGTNNWVDLTWFKLFASAFPAGQTFTVRVTDIPSDSASVGATSALKENTYYDALAKAWDRVSSAGTKWADMEDQNGNKIGEYYKAGSGLLDTVLDSMTVENELHVTEAVSGVDVTKVSII